MNPGSIYAVLLIAFLALAGLQSCATRLEIGSPPQVDRLAQLTPQISTKNDVLLTLGEPRGYGAARLNPSLKQQDVWLYEHSLSEGADIHLTMLVVFFVGDRYDGHMWFADAVSLKEYSRSKRK